MSLLGRVQSARSQGPIAQEDRARSLGIKVGVKDALYQQISAERIASMVGSNPAAARKELAAAIDRIMADPEIGGVPESERQRLKVDLLNDILGLGPLEPLLQDPAVTEIMVNGASSIFCERAGMLYQWPAEFDDDEHVLRVIDRIVSPLGRRVDERSPMVNARLPEGHRVNAVIPPVALNGPTLTIRKFRAKIFDLHELTEMDSLDEHMALLFGWAVKARCNIAVTGGTGSGKTTLLNALSIAIPEGERILTIEDSAELRFQRHPHVVSLEARPANIEGEGEISIRDLVVNALRMRPDRIVVGECRGGEALDMLQAMNTGHDGSLTTLHANTPHEAISRLVTMVRYSADLPVDAIREMIAGAVEMFIHQDRMADGSRRITRVVQTSGIRDGQVVLEDLIVWVSEGVDERGRAFGHYETKGTPRVLEKVVSQGVASAEEVQRWVSAGS